MDKISKFEELAYSTLVDSDLLLCTFNLETQNNTNGLSREKSDEYFQSRVQENCNRMRDTKADIIAVQELHPDIVETYKITMDVYGYAMISQVSKGKITVWSLLVGYFYRKDKINLIDAPFKNKKSPRKAYYVFGHKVSGEEYCIVNVHLKAGRDTYVNSITGERIECIPKPSDIRGVEVDHILEKLDKCKYNNTIICGDFNDFPHLDLYNKVIENNFVDVLGSTYEKEDIARPVTYSDLIIDYVFTRPHIKVKKIIELEFTKSSDHVPQLVVLELVTS